MAYKPFVQTPEMKKACQRASKVYEIDEPGLWQIRLLRAEALKIAVQLNQGRPPTANQLWEDALHMLDWILDGDTPYGRGEHD